MAIVSSNTQHLKTIKNRPIKWAKQRVRTIKPTHRVHKRNVSSTSTWSNHSRTTTGSSFSSVGSLVDLNAATPTPQPPTKPTSEVERLETELAYAYDAIATITVHFESLLSAYKNSKADVDKSASATRLCPMEKELLAAYDDLGLQVTHLERKIETFETKLASLRTTEQTPLSYDLVVSEATIKQEYASPMSVPSDSPCLSMFSPALEMKAEEAEALLQWKLTSESPIGSPVFYEDSPYLLMNEQSVPCMTPLTPVSIYPQQHDALLFDDAPCYATAALDSTFSYAYYETAHSPRALTPSHFPMTLAFPTWSSSPRAIFQ
ncbi:hypothetical protein BDF14DRAFT_1801322 [Spinellus fusiger]|nr:hypothetical protein BDF14DRAFT_1801322 [Spinellus fusiger]